MVEGVAELPQLLMVEAVDLVVEVPVQVVIVLLVVLEQLIKVLLVALEYLFRRLLVVVVEPEKLATLMGKF
jgi:hypothetical protein